MGWRDSVARSEAVHGGEETKRKKKNQSSCRVRRYGGSRNYVSFLFDRRQHHTCLLAGSVGREGGEGREEGEGAAKKAQTLLNTHTHTRAHRKQEV